MKATRRMAIGDKLWFFFLILVGLGVTTAAWTKEHEIFDGRSYNGRYYPRIEIVEGTSPNQPSHMEFQIYWKGHALDLSFELTDNEKGDKVMLLNYFIPERNERLCRRSLAPAHFHEGFLVYKDTSDKEMDNIIVTMTPLKDKPGLQKLNPKKYASCTMDEPTDRMPAGQAGDEALDNVDSDQPSGYTDQKRPNAGKGALKKSGAAVPFGDW